MLRTGLAGGSDVSSGDRAGAGSSGSSARPLDWAMAAGSSTPPTLQSEPCSVQLSLPDRLAQQQQQQALSMSSWGLSQRPQHEVAPLAGKRLQQQQQQSPTKPPAAGQSPAAAASSSASQHYLPQLGTAARLLCGKSSTTGGLMGRLDLSGALLARQ